jgi:enamine deaminase RidA (YjgF/YER057c/UK114 family)
MSRRLISSGSSFETSIGYSRAVIQGDWIFVSGTTGFDYASMTIEDDVVAQCEQAFRNIEAALKQAQSSLADVVRVHYLMTNGADFERCWPAMGKALGAVRPAATMMVVGLADARMKIEIEVTALRQKGVRRTMPKRATKPAAKRAPQKSGAPRRKK